MRGPDKWERNAREKEWRLSLSLKSEENMKQPQAGMGREWVVELSKETRSLVMDASSLVHT